jgi:MoxR-like ATPase
LVGVIAQLGATFVGRQDAIRAIALSHLCREHYLLVGPPGTAKTALAVAFAKHLEGRFFRTTFGSFATPSKVIGPMSIKAYQEGRYEYVTVGKLPESDWALLDEFFKGNESFLNELLTMMNERLFEDRPIPLRTAGCMTNWPELEARTDVVAALYDRVLLRCIVNDVEGDDLVAVLKAGDRLARGYTPGQTITVDDMEAACKAVEQVTISDALLELLASLKTRLSVRTVGGERRPGIFISSRRLVQAQRVLRANAWLEGRNEVEVDDFAALGWVLWNDRVDVETLRSVLDTIDHEEVRKALAVVDEARQAYRSLGGNAGPARMADVLEQIKTAAVSARAMFDRPVFTKPGREQVRKSMRGLKDDFEALRSKIQGGRP